MKAKTAGEAALRRFRLPAFGKGFAARSEPDETLSQRSRRWPAAARNVTVQFQVLEHPDQIVTVFKNADTGEVITQFPAQTMVVLAQFFNKLAGAVLDRTV